MNTKKYTHLFFDLDHTLWDFDTNSRLTMMSLYDDMNLAQKGIDDFEPFFKMYEAYNEELWDLFRKGKVRREELRWKRFAKTLLQYKIHNEALVQEMSKSYLEILPTKNALFSGAIDLLEYCVAHGYQLHIITNGFEATQLQKINNANLSQYFGHIITSEQAMALKPHKDIYQYAINMSNAGIESSLMIGDNYEVDILGAVNIGMDTAWYHQEHTLPSKATYHIKELSELKKIL